MEKEIEVSEAIKKDNKAIKIKLKKLLKGKRFKIVGFLVFSTVIIAATVLALNSRNVKKETSEANESTRDTQSNLQILNSNSTSSYVKGYPASHTKASYPKSILQANKTLEEYINPNLLNPIIEFDTTEFENLDTYTLSSFTKLSDGKFLIVGSAHNEPSTCIDCHHMVLIKFNEDGEIDRTFGEGGFSIYKNNSFGSLGRAVTEDSEGNYIVSGDIDYRLTLWKYTKEGKLDTTFGTNGYFYDKSLFPEIMNPDKTFIYDKVNNRYLLIGNTYETSYLVAVNSQGKLDKSFNNSGKLLLENYLFNGEIHNTKDGYLVLPNLQKFNYNGTQDDSFNRNIGDIPHYYTAVFDKNSQELNIVSTKELIGNNIFLYYSTYDSKGNLLVNTSGIKVQNFSNIADVKPKRFLKIKDKLIFMTAARSGEENYESISNVFDLWEIKNSDIVFGHNLGRFGFFIRSDIYQSRMEHLKEFDSKLYIDKFTYSGVRADSSSNDNYINDNYFIYEVNVDEI